MKIWFESKGAEEHPATGRLLLPGVNEFDPPTAIELKRCLGDRVRLATPGEVERARLDALEAEKRSIASAERAAQELLGQEAAAQGDLAAARAEAALELGIVDERGAAADVPVSFGAAAAPAGDSDGLQAIEPVLGAEEEE